MGHSDAYYIRKDIDELKATIEKLARTGISSGQLRAQSLSVMVSSRTRCNAGCMFCISRTTPGDDPNGHDIVQLDFDRLKVGLDYAARCGAVTAILTGKADPLQEHPYYLIKLIRTCRAKMPTVDMHTNGLGMRKKYNFKELADAGLTMITFSIANFSTQVNSSLMGPAFKKIDHTEMIREAREAGLLVRCSLVLNVPTMYNSVQIHEYLMAAKEAGAHQVVIRELWLPDVAKESTNEVWEWNSEHKVKLEGIYQHFLNESQNRNGGVKFVRFLPWGTAVFDYQGMNVTFARCEESFNGGTLKSIVHKVDGHGYMDWDHDGSILY